MPPRPPKLKRIASAKDAADYLAELKALRDAVATTEARVKALSDELLRWFAEERLDELAVEGLPLAVVRHVVRRRWVLDQMATAEPDLVLQLARAGALNVAVEPLRGAVGSGKVTGNVAKYERPSGGWKEIRFERPEDDRRRRPD